MLGFIDTHAHLNDDVYKNVSFDESFFSYGEFIVNKTLTVSYSKESILDNFKLCKENQRIYAVIGIHPQNCFEYNEEIENLLRELSVYQKVVAIGEIGLEYYRLDENKKEEIINKQKEVFIKQIKLAHELGLPIVVHTRDAKEDTLKILKEHKEYLTNCGVVHCFSEDYDAFLKVKELGLCISVGGVLTFKNGQELRTVIEKCDIEDVLIETDCPYLTPEPLRGKVVNSPILAKHVIKKVAELKQMSVEDVCAKTSHNACRVFRKIVI